MLNERAKPAYWRKLDHAAILFSAASNDIDTRVFRFYCELNEEIIEEDLQEAVELTMTKFPLFLSVMRKGMFWYYLEKSDLKPIVKKEHRSPCSSIFIRDQMSLLFHVTYYKERINFEVFHALTDGTGATEFLKELVKNYLVIHFKEDELPNVPLLNQKVMAHDQEGDSFTKYYSNVGKKQRKKKVKAFQIRGIRGDGRELQVTESMLSVKQVVEKARNYKVSLSVFISTVFLCAIHKEMNKRQEKKPVVLMVPINLRKFFHSESMLNFFGWLYAGHQFGEGKDSFEEILEQVKQTFEKELTRDYVEEQMNGLMEFEKNPVLRFVPFGIKQWGILIGSKISSRETTAIYSNMSAVVMPEVYESYINYFGVFTSTPKTELCMCSFKDKLVLNFTSRYDSLNIQRNFFEVLEELELSVDLPKPKFPEKVEPLYAGKRFFQWFSFVCIVAAVVAAMVNVIATPNSYWAVIVSGGILSTWIASAIGFLKRRNLLKNATWQLFFVTTGCIIWDVGTGWHGWSLNYVFPIVCLVMLISMLAIKSMQKLKPHEYIIYFFMGTLYGMIPFVLLLIGLIDIRYPSVICAGISFLFLVALAIFKRREFFTELQKKFHV